MTTIDFIDKIAWEGGPLSAVSRRQLHAAANDLIDAGPIGAASEGAAAKVHPRG
jgi:hypothetical protein